MDAQQREKDVKTVAQMKAAIAQIVARPNANIADTHLQRSIAYIFSNRRLIVAAAHPDFQVVCDALFGIIDKAYISYGSKGQAVIPHVLVHSGHLLCLLIETPAVASRVGVSPQAAGTVVLLLRLYVDAFCTASHGGDGQPSAALVTVVVMLNKLCSLVVAANPDAVIRYLCKEFPGEALVASTVVMYVQSLTRVLAYILGSGKYSNALDIVSTAIMARVVTCTVRFAHRPVRGGGTFIPEKRATDICLTVSRLVSDLCDANADSSVLVLPFSVPNATKRALRDVVLPLVAAAKPSARVLFAFAGIDHPEGILRVLEQGGLQQDDLYADQPLPLPWCTVATTVALGRCSDVSAAPNFTQAMLPSIMTPAMDITFPDKESYDNLVPADVPFLLSFATVDAAAALLRRLVEKVPESKPIVLGALTKCSTKVLDSAVRKQASLPRLLANFGWNLWCSAIDILRGGANFTPPEALEAIVALARLNPFLYYMSLQKVNERRKIVPQNAKAPLRDLGRAQHLLGTIVMSDPATTKAVVEHYSAAVGSVTVRYGTTIFATHVASFYARLFTYKGILQNVPLVDVTRGIFESASHCLAVATDVFATHQAYNALASAMMARPALGIVLAPAFVKLCVSHPNSETSVPIEVQRCFAANVRTVCQTLEPISSLRMSKEDEDYLAAATSVPADELRAMSGIGAALHIVDSVAEAAQAYSQVVPSSFEGINTPRRTRNIYALCLVNLLQCSDSRVLTRVCNALEDIILHRMSPDEHNAYLGAISDVVHRSTNQSVKKEVATWLLKLEAMLRGSKRPVSKL